MNSFSAAEQASAAFQRPGAAFYDTGVHPTHPRFWGRAGAGHQPLLATAWSHVVAGLLAAGACGYLWLHGATPQRGLLELSIAGAVVALAGAGAALLDVFAHPIPALVARLLLPLADLGAAGVAYWVLGMRDLVLPLFVVAPVVACVLFSWRGGAACAALALVGITGLAAVRMGPALEAWVPELAVLGGILLVLTVTLGAFAARVAAVAEAQSTRIHTLRRERDAQAAEQGRLLDGLSLIEETQACLEQERVRVNTQIAGLVAATQRLAEGDADGVRSLRPGMYGPLDLLLAALGRLAAQAPRQRSETSALAADGIAATVRDQGRLLAATDDLLRELGMRANELIAGVQFAQQEAGASGDASAEPAFATLRELERVALAQASSAAALGTRLAQVLVRQNELEVELRRASRHADPSLSGAAPLWPAAAAPSAGAVARRTTWSGEALPVIVHE
ncbi:MAG: hypothetical protein ACHQ4H_17480 [Ktedonobacterales bacterium]